MTQTWLFQANPKTFDIDGFLATRPSAFLWLVTRSGERMRVGDRVFLWRAVAGEDEARSGVVAETEIADAPSERPEDAASMPFWRSGDPALPRLRVRLRTVRVAGSAKEVVQRKWALEDPVLRDMTILKAANATNFLLTDEQATRMGALWAKTGRNFTYAESVAALWVYKETYGGSVSRLPGSAVANMALRIGRAVPGVYNKVMNFRHLDPRDERAGPSGGSDIDASVWSRFFDAEARTLRDDALDAEYLRLWTGAGAEPPDAAVARDEAVEREASRLASEPLAALLARHSAAGRPAKPKVAAVRPDSGSSATRLSWRLQRFAPGSAARCPVAPTPPSSTATATPTARSTTSSRSPSGAKTPRRTWLACARRTTGRHTTVLGRRRSGMRFWRSAATMPGGRPP